MTRVNPGSRPHHGPDQVAGGRRPPGVVGHDVDRVAGRHVADGLVEVSRPCRASAGKLVESGSG